MQNFPQTQGDFFTDTMGTMRNNFAAVFVLHILMHLTSQSLPLRGTNENSSKRNSLSELRSTSSPIYECLFLDPDLPVCDEKLWVTSISKFFPYFFLFSLFSLSFFFSFLWSCKGHYVLRGIIEWRFAVIKKKVWNRVKIQRRIEKFEKNNRKLYFLRCESCFFLFLYFFSPSLLIPEEIII